MLVLSRRPGECIRIGREMEVTVLEVRGNHVKLGFSAPSEIPIHRGEVYQRIEERIPALEQAECA